MPPKHGGRGRHTGNPDNPMPAVIRTGKKKTYTTGVSLYERDVELLIWMSSYLGTSRSEVMRTALRSMAMHLASLDPHIRKSGKDAKGMPKEVDEFDLPMLSQLQR